MGLAFDHNGIVEHAHQFLRKHRFDADVMAGFFHMNFAVKDYRDVVQRITGKDINSSNFRRKVLADDVVEAVTEISRGKRALYRFIKET